MADAQKKVILRPFAGDPVNGYLPATGFASGGHVRLMNAAGRVISFPVSDVKLIAYVRDFNSADRVDPERLGRRAFPARPRTEGLWLRMTFRDGDTLEGLSALDLSFLDAVTMDGGLSVTPPDSRSNTQRVFVPRPALMALDLLGLIASAANRKPASKPVREPEPWLFDNT